MYRYKSVAVISAIAILIPTIASVLLVYFAEEADKLSSRVYGFYLPSAMIGLVCAGMLIAKGKSFKLEHCKYAFKLSLPLLVHYLTVYLLTSTNIVITKSILGREEAAIISIATSVIHILTILFQSISGAITTWLMDNLEQKKYEKVKKESLVYLGLLACVSVGVILLAPEVVWILGGNKYIGAIPLIPGLVLSVFIQSVTTIFTIILTYDKNVTKTAIFTGIVAVLSIVAKILLLPVLGVESLPFVNIVACIILFAVNYILVRKAGYGKVIDFKKYMLFIIPVCAVMAASYLLYDNRIIRYGILVAFVCGAGFVFFKKRAMIMALIKKRKKKAE